jgi:hypothetical protein
MWDVAASWTDIVASLKNFTGAVNAVGHTYMGNYWLIGGDDGCLNRYDGASTWTDLKTSVNFTPYNIKAMAFGGSYWLIAGTGGRIFQYNGTYFTDLTAKLLAAWGGYYDVYSLDYNGAYWVVAGGAGKIAVYDGVNFYERDPGGTPLYSVWSVKWNGSYWLIGGCQGANQAVFYTTPDALTVPYTEQANPAYFTTVPIWSAGTDSQASAVNLIGGGNGKLMKRTGTYNLPVNQDLSRDAVDFGARAINFAESNGSYWIIGGAEGALNRFDGLNFTDLRPELGWETEDVMSAAWNQAGSYWLIAGKSGKLAKYDGFTFYDRTGSLGASGADINTLQWNGSQWLIGGRGRSLHKSADGDIFTSVDISAYFGPADSVNDVEWSVGENVWYVAGSSGCVVTFDGTSSFQDFKSGLYACFSGYYGINSMKGDGAGKIRLGCDGARLADCESGVFTNRSADLVNFGTASVYSVEYSPAAQLWMIAGNLGKINSVTGGGPGVFEDQSGSLVNFKQAAINDCAYSGGDWLIAGDNAKLNRFGLFYNSPAWACSKPVDSWFAGYDSVTLTAAYVQNNQQVDFWLSSNNGATWVQVQPGIGAAFAGADAGTSLLWRARLLTYDASVSPYIDTVIIDYRRKTAPTYTFTATSTRTRTHTSTPTFTGTFTNTVTATPTGTCTMTATPTATMTFTMTATGTFTRTPTFTATATPSRTASATDTATNTRTHSVTPTFTGTPTCTATMTITETHTITKTWTVSPTVTKTPTMTHTPTVTPTFTITNTWTVTSSVTMTGTITPTRTITATGTVTMTPVSEFVLPAENECFLFPNPASTWARVSYFMKGQGSVLIRIYNEAGDLAAKIEENRPAGNGTSLLDTSRMAPGVYLWLLTMNYSTGPAESFGVKKFLIIR